MDIEGKRAGRDDSAGRDGRGRNDYALVALVLGLVAVIASLATVTAWVPALAGLVCSGIAIASGVRHDARLAAAVSGLVLNLLALLITVFSAGIDGSVGALARVVGGG